LSEHKKEISQTSANAIILGNLSKSIQSVIYGKEDVIKEVIIALLARGNLLIDDIPGVGKTSLARALAGSINCSFKRIQFTSDLLPSDILGVKVYEPKDSEFRFLPGPIFNSIILADEINRASPRTQSALLEAMSEKQVTIEGETYKLERPFMVIATENPIDTAGTYPLPDSQLDRFLMTISVGYPPPEYERKLIMEKNDDDKTDSVSPVMNSQDVIKLQNEVDKIKVESDIADYILSVINLTRSHKHLKLGSSPRGSLALNQTAKARALLEGRTFVVPDDVKKSAGPVLEHRVVPKGPVPTDEKRRLSKEIVEDILDSVPVPV
jgi:MoxR-like ATPase